MPRAIDGDKLVNELKQLSLKYAPKKSNVTFFAIELICKWILNGDLDLPERDMTSELKEAMELLANPPMHDGPSEVGKHCDLHPMFESKFCDWHQRHEALKAKVADTKVRHEWVDGNRDSLNQITKVCKHCWIPMGCDKTAYCDDEISNQKAELPQRDMTPEEALAEARKRWGENAFVECTLTANDKGICFVGKQDDHLKEFRGSLFREAFESADKANAENGK